LVQVNAWIPGEHELQSLFSTGSSRGLFPDVELVGRERDPLEERMDLARHRSSRPQGFEDRNNGVMEIPAQLGDWMKPSFGQRNQLPQGKLGLGVAARDDLLLCPVLLQRRCGGLVGVWESSCRGNQRMRRRRDRARVEKREGKHTTKGFLQPQQTGLDPTVAGMPNTDLLVMTLTVKLPESLQLADSGVAALDSILQGRAKLVHLAFILCGEDSFLLGQLAVNSSRSDDSVPRTFASSVSNS
jgi:hypothetical protein